MSINRKPSVGFFLVVVAGRKTPVVSDQQRQENILVLTGH